MLIIYTNNKQYKNKRTQLCILFYIYLQIYQDHFTRLIYNSYSKNIHRLR